MARKKRYVIVSPLDGQDAARFAPDLIGMGGDGIPDIVVPLSINDAHAPPIDDAAGYRLQGSESGDRFVLVRATSSLPAWMLWRAAQLEQWRQRVVTMLAAGWHEFSAPLDASIQHLGQYRRRLIRGMATAAVIGSLLLGGNQSVRVAAAPSINPPPPWVEQLVKQTETDQRLRQIIRQAGPNSVLGRFLRRAGPDSPLGRLIEQTSPDNPLRQLLEQTSSQKQPDERRPGVKRGQRPAGAPRKDGKPAGPVSTVTPAAPGAQRNSQPGPMHAQGAKPASPAFAAWTPPIYVERPGDQDPLHDPVDVGESSKPVLVDIDGDGVLEAFVGGFYCYHGCYGYVAYFENEGDNQQPRFVEQFGPYSNPLWDAYADDQQLAPAFVDIDGDGDLDAFVGTSGRYSGYGHIRFFENTGSASNPTFVERTGPSNPFYYTYGHYLTPTFADIDGDGDMDAFVGEQYTGGPVPYLYSGRVRFFRNTGEITPTTMFTEVIGAGNPLNDAHLSFPAPAFVDIDADGDMDAFVGGMTVSIIPFSGASPDAAVPIPVSFDVQFYKNIGDDENPLLVRQTPVNNPLSQVSAPWAAPTFADINADGDYDAFIGAKTGMIQYYENVGDAETATMTRRAGPVYPFGGVSGYFDHPVFVDIDGDGDKDVFVGHEGSYGYDSVRFLQNMSQENYGDNKHPAFVERMGAENPLSVATGYYMYDTAPAFVDIDGDGDMDAFVGHETGYITHTVSLGSVKVSGQVYDSVRFFRNVGDRQKPLFVEQTGSSNPLNVATGPYMCYTAPTFVDINGDGLTDAFVGHKDGPCFYDSTKSGNPSPKAPKADGYDAVRFFVNTGEITPTTMFSEVVGAGNPLHLADYAWGGFTAPTFVDIDGDGDFDAFLGQRGYFDDFDYHWYGGVDFLRNVGTRTSPLFYGYYGYQASNPLRDAYYSGFTAPTFVDINGDGMVDAFVGDFGYSGFGYYDHVHPILRDSSTQGPTENPKPGLRSQRHDAKPGGVQKIVFPWPQDSIRYFERGAKTYLPLIARNYFAAPDLMVERVIATHTSIQVVVKNQGAQPVTQDFWVDAYVNPSPAPTRVNQLWNAVGSQGAAWGVTSPSLQPGGMITLTTGGAYYDPVRSHITWPLPAGTKVYAQADSWDPSTTYGAVLESHEIAGGVYNNITGPTVVTVVMDIQ